MIHKRFKIKLSGQTLEEMKDYGKKLAQSHTEEDNDWSRPFRKIHRDLKNLKSFAIVNQNAAIELSNRFMRANFDIPDNVVDKVLTKNIYEMEFGKRANIEQVL